MNADALLLMLLTILVIWGGLVSTASALVIWTRREKREAHAEAMREVLQETAS